MSELRDIVNNFIDSQALLKKSDFGYSDLAKFSKAVKSSTKCTNVDLTKVSFNSIAKLAQSDLYTGEQLVDASEDILRNALAGNKESDASVDSFFNTSLNLKVFSDGFDLDKGHTNYVSRYSNVMKQYNAFVSQALKLVNDQNSNVAMNLDADSVVDLSNEVNSLMEEYRDAVSIVTTSGLNRQKRLTSEEALLADIIEIKLLKRLSLAQEKLDIYEQITDISHDFQSQADLLMKNGVSSGKIFRQNIKEVSNAWRAGDYLEVAKKLVHFARNRKQLLKSAPAKDAFMEALGGLVGGFSKLELLALFFKLLSPVLKLLTGIDDTAAEFNKKMLENHSIISMGMDLNPEVSVNINAILNKFREMFTAFGADTKSFFNADKVMELTSMYEQQGIKLKELTSDTHDFNAIMATTLNYAAMSGMAAQDLAKIQAGWRRDLSMDARLMNVLLSKYLHSSANAGVPMQMLIDNLQESGYDFTLWNDSMASVIELQDRILRKKNIPKGTGKDAFKYFGEYLSSMDPVNWDEFLSALPHTAMMDMIAKEEIRLQDKIKNATSEDERKKAQFLLGQLQSAKKESDPIWLKKYIARNASIETKYKIIQQSLQSKFGSGLHNELSQGVVSMATDQRLKAFFHFSGSAADWEKMKIVLTELTDPSFDPDAAVKEANDMHDNMPQTEIEKLNAQALAIYEQQTTIREMFESMITKYLNKIITVMESIRHHLRNFWLIKLLGGESKEATQIADTTSMLKEITDFISNYATEKDPEKKAKMLPEILTKAAEFVNKGGNIKEIIDFAKSAGLKDGNLLEPLMNLATNALDSSGMSKEEIKNQLDKFFPGRASVIEKVITEASKSLGIPSNFITSAIISKVSRDIADDPSNLIKLLKSSSAKPEDIQKAIMSYFNPSAGQGGMLFGLIKSWPLADQNLAMSIIPRIGGMEKFNQFFKTAKSVLKHDPTSWEEFTKAAHSALPADFSKIISDAAATISGLNITSGSLIPSIPGIGPQAESPSRVEEQQNQQSGTSSTASSTFSYGTDLGGLPGLVGSGIRK